MQSHIDIPVDACRIRLSEDALDVNEPQEEGRKPRFRMRVNSGIPMQHPFFGTLAVNLDGVQWQGKHLPALLDHDPEKRVGYTTKLYLDEDEGMVAEGILLSNENAQLVRQDSLDGFPWQASCYLTANDVVQLADGDTLNVNGQDVDGPAYVFNTSTLREVTFCALGQDPNTSSDATLHDGVQTVRAKLSVLESSTMNEQQEQTAQDNAPVVDVDAVRLDAQQQASERVAYILECAADVQIDLARQLIKDGTNERDAALALSQDMKKRDRVAAPAVTPTAATQPLGAVLTDANTPAEYADNEDGWRQQWQADATLRAEFGSSEGAWLSYNKNKHRCRSYGIDRRNEEIN